MKQPGSVDPDEIALILLRNALRLLEQSLAPAAVRIQVEKAISELEALVSPRKSAIGKHD